MLGAYPKIWNIGAPEVRETLFKGGVQVTEKLDGSQLGFGLDSDGKLVIRSKGTYIYRDEYLRKPESLFSGAVDYLISIKDKLAPETSYYGEVLSTKRHNTLTYGSVPRNYVVLYGIQSHSVWVDDHDILTAEADKLGFDSVPLIYSGVINSADELKEFLNRESWYGGTKIEGVVVKNFNQLAISAFSSACYGKLVSEKFKEMNHTNWAGKPGKVEEFYQSFTNKARWDKTIQHLRDDGKLTNSPKDIGLVIETCLADFEQENKEVVKEQLYKLYIRQIKQYVTRGLPEYFKEYLVSQSSFGVPEVPREQVLPAQVGACYVSDGLREL